MGLQGNLEDLPITDILQVIGFTQRSGSLVVRAPGLEAGLVFRRGRLVGAWVAGGAGPVPPGPPDERAAAIRRRIESALALICGLGAGRFTLDLDDAAALQDGSHPLGGPMLVEGLSPQELLLHLAQLDDERRRGVPALPEAVRAAQSSASHRVVLLFDDDDELRRALARRLMAAGYQVCEAATSGAALLRAWSFAELGLPFVLLAAHATHADVGEALDGGLEVVARLRAAGLDVPVVVLTDRSTPALVDSAGELGVAEVVATPARARLDRAQYGHDLAALAARLVHEILPPLAKAAEHA